MYKKLPKLTEENKNILLNISNNVTFKPAISHRRRVGLLGKDNLSVYNNSKYLKWTSSQRAEFASCIDENIIKNSLVCWFVQFPANSGFLDKLDTWVNDKSPAWVTCYLIKGKGKVSLNDEIVDIEEGEAISYSLDMIHGVESTQEGSVWACVMTPKEV